MEQYFIFRGDRSGATFGKLGNQNGREVEIIDAQRLWYWNGAASLFQLALEGVKVPRDCKFTVTLPKMTILDCIEILPCSEEAVNCIRGVSVWKR